MRNKIKSPRRLTGRGLFTIGRFSKGIQGDSDFWKLGKDIFIYGDERYLKIQSQDNELAIIGGACAG
jgi:hypothetical protein